MLTSICRCRFLLKSESKLKWALIVVIAIVMTGVETVGAVSVILLALVQLWAKHRLVQNAAAYARPISLVPNLS